MVFPTSDSRGLEPIDAIGVWISGRPVRFYALQPVQIPEACETRLFKSQDAAQTCCEQFSTEYQKINNS